MSCAVPLNRFEPAPPAPAEPPALPPAPALPPTPPAIAPAIAPALPATAPAAPKAPPPAPPSMGAPALPAAPPRFELVAGSSEHAHAASANAQPSTTRADDRATPRAWHRDRVGR